MKVDDAFLRSVGNGHGFDARACINCGSCTALCPMGIPLLPRKMFRLVMLGAREKVLAEADTIFSCLLCKMCEENCPGGVPITENVRQLRGYLDRELFGLAPSEAHA